MPEPHTPPAFAPDAWARVSARDHTTHYRRLGAGRAVVVLAPPAAPNDRWPALADALARRWRVVLPDVPRALGGAGGAAPDVVADWLHDFLEALGMPAAALVAAEPFWDAALRVAAAQDGLCDRVVLARGGAARARGARGLGVRPHTLAASVPVFDWRWDPAAADAAADLHRCLAAPDPEASPDDR